VHIFVGIGFRFGNLTASRAYRRCVPDVTRKDEGGGGTCVFRLGGPIYRSLRSSNSSRSLCFSVNTGENCEVLLEKGDFPEVVVAGSGV
jgi:hypothetical protein